jgi:predicted P-loop ATPase
MLNTKNIWLNWKFETTKDGRKTKVPYQLNGKKASSTDPNSWTNFKKANDKVKDKTFDGVGIVFEPSEGILGIDFDHCIKAGQITMPEIAKFVKKAKTYTEYSPSKTGLHLLFQCKEPLNLERNKHNFNDEGTAIEIYNNGRYFTFTGNKIAKDTPKIRKIKADEFIELIKTIGYPFKKEEEVHEVPQEISQDIEPDDDKLLERIFNSKNGSNVKALYEGDISIYDNDYSGAEFALCLHLAFWTAKNKERMERIWLNSPLGSRKKTQQRKDYRDRTLDGAIRNTNDVYTPDTITKESDKEEYLMSPNKNKPEPLLVLENIVRVISRDDKLNKKFRLNEFSHMTETIWDQDEWVVLNDSAILEVQRYISINYPYFVKVSKAMTTDAILAVAYRNRVNPPRDYLTSLTWDGTPRLNSWLHKAYGVADDELNQAIGSNWLKGMVKRVMQPACQFDEVLALESPQGWRKSTSIRVLGGEWHVETTHSLDDKDFYMILAQNIIVEFSEGDIFDRNSVKKLKAEITKTEDQVRLPYERGVQKFKRSCVFAVTTNKLELKDETGNRRWLPVTLEKPADIDWLQENRNQLIAEAYHRVVILNETTWEYPENLSDLQDSRAEWTEHDETVLMWYASLSQEDREEGIPLKRAVDETFPATHNKTRNDELNTATILRRTLKMENRNKRVDGAVVKRWMPTEKTMNIIKDIKTDEF